MGFEGKGWTDGQSDRTDHGRADQGRPDSNASMGEYSFSLLVEAVRINFPLCNKLVFFFLQMAPGNAELLEYGRGGKAVRQ